MKKILYIFAVLTLIFICACSDSYEQMLVGRWTLVKAEIVDFDDFCDYQSRLSTEELEKKIKQIDMELETVDEVHKPSLQQQKELAESQKLQCVPDSIKADVSDNMNQLLGNFFFDLRSNKTFSLSSPNDSVSGTWSLKGDSIISTLLSGRPSEDINIISLSNSKLEVSTTEIDDEGYEITTLMSFTK